MPPSLPMSEFIQRVPLTRRLELLGDRPHPSSVDGVVRAGEDEQRLNQMAAIAFSTGAGRDFLDYLKTITLFRVSEFGVSTDELRQREGARWLVNLILERVHKGRQDRNP